jgi:hypothetical protein
VSAVIMTAVNKTKKNCCVAMFTYHCTAHNKESENYVGKKKKLKRCIAKIRDRETEKRSEVSAIKSADSLTTFVA